MSFGYTQSTHLSESGGLMSNPTTASISVPAGAIILVGATFYTPDGTNAVAGSGLTFTAVSAASSNRTKLWKATVPGGGFSGTLSFTGSLFSYSVGYWTNATSIVQVKTVMAQTGLEPVTIAFDSTFADPSNGAYAFWRTEQDPTGSVGGSGWATEFAELSGTFAVGTVVQDRATSDTGATLDFSGSIGSTTVDLIAVEVGNAGGGGGGGSAKLPPKQFSGGFYN